MERAAATAGEAERARQHEHLHRVTIAALERIAEGDQVDGTIAVARAEAGRLRYALRTSGRPPEGLDEALADLVEAAAGAGRRIELVAAELDARPDPAATAALRGAIQVALDAARELGGASRAVVRAAGTADWVTVTVRDHGAGFAPGSGSPHEARLMSVAALLEGVGGTLEVWSEPDSGVRLTLTVRIGAGSVQGSGIDDPAQGLPHPGRGMRAAGDDDRIGGESDVDSAIVGGGIEGTQDQIGVTRLAQVELGGARDPLQTRAQHRLAGRDASRGGLHPASVAPLGESAVGRIAPFSELPASATRLADGTLLTALLAWRLTGLVTGAAALAAGRDRYRSRPVALGQLVGAAGESLWYSRRAWRRDRWSDAPAAWVDAATAVALLLVGQANLEPPDRAT